MAVPKTPPIWRPLLTTALPVALSFAGRSLVAEPMIVGSENPKPMPIRNQAGRMSAA